MRVILGFKLGFFTLLILIGLVFSGTYFVYTKFTGINNPLKTESTAEIVSSSKSNADKSESSSEAFFRDNRERFFKK